MHLDVLDSVPQTGPQRKKLMAFIYGLRERPETRGDFTDNDESLRKRQIKIIGDYAVTNWFDVPVQIVMVVDIRPAGS